VRSPFPGMDPYLEGYLWPDVHQALAGEIRRRLVPLVDPRYAVRLAVYMLSDRVPAGEIGITVPDVEVIQPHRPPPSRPVGEAAAVAIAPPPVRFPLAVPLVVRQTRVEVRDIAGNSLVTAIEILSPANKRPPGQAAYIAKRDGLRARGVHMIEIDLLRRLARPWPHGTLPVSDYTIVLLRAQRAEAEVWPVALRERLPTLPVPLRTPDPDVPLDLQAALDAVFAEARYARTLDYGASPPEPPLNEADAAWAAGRVSAWRAESPEVGYP